MQAILFALFGGVILWKLNKGNTHISMKTLVGNERRNWDEPISIEAWRAAGQYLHNSGHPDEIRHRVNVPMSLKEVRHHQTRKLEGNRWLLNSHYFNTSGITKRQQFSGPSDEIHWPLLEMGSDWYNKSVSVSGHKPYLTRIIPWNGYNQ